MFLFITFVALGFNAEFGPPFDPGELEVPLLLLELLPELPEDDTLLDLEELEDPESLD